MGIPWVLVGRRIVLLEIPLPQYWFGEKCCLKNARQPWFMIGAPVFRVLLRVIVSSAVYSVHLRYAIQHFVRYRSSPQGAEHLDFKKKKRSDTSSVTLNFRYANLPRADKRSEIEDPQADV